MIQKLHDKLKNFINSIRVPPLLSFFITRSGIINPTKEQALTDATPAKDNWVRLGLDRITSIGLPVWVIFIFCLIITTLSYFSQIIYFSVQIFSQLTLASNTLPQGSAIAFKYSTDALLFFIQLIGQFGVYIPMLIIGYYIYKNFFGKTK